MTDVVGNYASPLLPLRALEVIAGFTLLHLGCSWGPLLTLTKIVDNPGYGERKYPLIRQVTAMGYTTEIQCPLVPYRNLLVPYNNRLALLRCARTVAVFIQRKLYGI